MWTQHSIEIATLGRGFHDVTVEVGRCVASGNLRVGSCHPFLQHTSASLCITENADADVRGDLERFAQRLVPDGDPLFRHDTEGDDDMPAHVRNLIVGCELTVPVRDGRLVLGTWQGVYLWEHRSRPHRRVMVVTLNGEPRT